LQKSTKKRKKSFTDFKRDDILSLVGENNQPTIKKPFLGRSQKAKEDGRFVDNGLHSLESAS